MKNVKKLVAMAIIASTVSVNMAYAAPINEVVGKTAVETSIELAQKSWNGNWKGEKTVVLAAQNEENLVDALAVAPLAYSKKAPILLVNKGDEVNKPVLEELKAKEINKVYLASGEGVLTDKMKKQLEDEKIEVVRIGGKNRIETSENIAKELGEYSKVAVVGYNGIADAISIAPIASAEGMAIAIVGSNGELTKDYKVDMEDKEAYILGGETLVSKKTEEEVKGKRIAGKDRYETNAKVLETFKDELEFNTLYMPSGLPNKLKDGLTASVLAAQSNDPIVLLGQAKAQMEETNKVLTANVNKDTEISIIGQAKSDKILELIKEFNDRIDELNKKAEYKFEVEGTIANKGSINGEDLKDKDEKFFEGNSFITGKLLKTNEGADYAGKVRIKAPKVEGLQLWAYDSNSKAWYDINKDGWGTLENTMEDALKQDVTVYAFVEGKKTVDVTFDLIDVETEEAVVSTEVKLIVPIKVD